jgi:hypothetical protein
MTRYLERIDDVVLFVYYEYQKKLGPISINKRENYFIFEFVDRKQL